jgi:hypothetical protein
MSIEKIHLRKLLQLFYADSRLRRSLLRADIRADQKKKAIGPEEGARDFYGPFWADVKNHAAGISDLSEQTKFRIKSNKTRKRLYTILKDCFLEMWNEKIRWRNEPFEFFPASVKAQPELKKIQAVIKIENTVAVKTWDDTNRVIYPYFSEFPALPEEGVRLGFWALQTAFPEYPMDEFRIVDMQRRAYFRPAENRAKGDEEKLFIEKYRALSRERKKLEEEYH